MRKHMNRQAGANHQAFAQLAKAGKQAKKDEKSAHNFMQRAAKIGTVLGGSLSRKALASTGVKAPQHKY